MPKEVPANNAAAARRAEVFSALHKEMEIAAYPTGKSGQKVRRVPRSQMPARLAKQKVLEADDMEAMGIERDGVYVGGGNGGLKKGRKRLRGSHVALQDAVLKSMPIAGYVQRKKIAKQSNDSDGDEIIEEEDYGLEGNERDEVLHDVAALGIDLDPDDLGKIDTFEDDEENDLDDDDDFAYDRTEKAGSDESEADQVVKDTKPAPRRFRGKNRSDKLSDNGIIKPKTTRKMMHRLREFTSKRMAAKHGEAVGAHIMGMSETAVQKLREVAKLAPGAPQVYSSLGMVYESMLAELDAGRAISEQGEDETEETSQFNHLIKRLELAGKTYASYHIASILCKRDYVLWERSGDAAMKVAQTFNDIIDQKKAELTGKGEAIITKEAQKKTEFDPDAGAKKWRSDRKIWLNHALLAYQSADFLRPPGVDVPCKLAQVHMALGSYIDALSILTDLRNRASELATGDENESDRVLGRTEMEGSFPCWLLYADLMVNMGFECIQWNAGTSTNSHYMFKRWLRKNSKGFDWKERRLQALVLALEAAAGSESCAKLMKWMTERAKKFLFEDEKKDADKRNGVDENAEDDAEGDTNGRANSEEMVAEKAELPTAVSTYEKEREKLIRVNKVELQSFDRMTREMNLIVGSIIFNNRIATRAAMIQKHRVAIKDLATHEYAEKQQDASSDANPSANEQPDLPEDESFPKPLPLQGSCATVYDIAALLLRQCIQMKLFNGGLFTVRSIFDYSKERVSRHERKMRLKEENERLQSEEQGFLPMFKYDQINFGSDDDDGEGFGTYISDDEELEQPDVLQSLKDGSLPVDIKAMYSICLLGVGGQDYVALNGVEQVIMSNELSMNENDDFEDTSINDNPRWKTFSKQIHAPVNQSFLLASIADIMTENSKKHPPSHRVLRIFRNHLQMDSNEGLERALSGPNELNRVQALKILLAALKQLIDCARVDLSMLGDPEKEEVKIVERAVAKSIYALKIMTRFHHILWSPSFSDWSLPATSITMISVLSAAISILVQATSLLDDKSLLDSLEVGFDESRDLISTICFADNAAPKPATYSNVETWRSYPLPCSWQNSFHHKISLRAYNLCVGCCVSSFSGWEPSEFNLDQLRNTDMNFFGVSLEGSSVAGFLPKSVVSVIAEQWDYIQGILPELDVLPFESHLDEQKTTSWYKKVMKGIESQNIDPNKIPLHGEDEGLKALLSFSTLCLISAEECEGDERDEFVKLSMSVLLPLTQFSISEPVWYSLIGKKVITNKNETKLDYYLDENCIWLGPTKSIQGRIQFSASKKPPPSKEVARRAPARRHRPTNVLRVPASALLDEWRRDNASEDNNLVLEDEDAHVMMKKVDDAMKNLRKSRTLDSLERASIDVSVALLGVATNDECNNPFVCLQQAAMFAAMGPKKGNNDEPFKKFLPLKRECSTVDALNILGRADCLRAVLFMHEAQYLCTWVATVCSYHRDPLDKEMPWSSRWRAIAMLTYMVAATIDETGEALSQDDPNAGSLRKWEQSAKEEIGYGKADAVAMINNRLDEVTTTHFNQEALEILPMESKGPDKQRPLTTEINRMDELNDAIDHFEYPGEINGSNNEHPNFGQEAPQIEVESVEGGDDYNPIGAAQMAAGPIQGGDDYNPIGAAQMAAWQIQGGVAYNPLAAAQMAAGPVQGGVAYNPLAAPPLAAGPVQGGVAYNPFAVPQLEAGPVQGGDDYNPFAAPPLAAGPMQGGDDYNPFAAPQLEDGPTEEEDDYDPFAGVEVVGI